MPRALSRAVEARMQARLGRIKGYIAAKLSKAEMARREGCLLSTIAFYFDKFELGGSAVSADPAGAAVASPHLAAPADPIAISLIGRGIPPIMAIETAIAIRKRAARAAPVERVVPVPRKAGGPFRIGASLHLST